MTNGSEVDALACASGAWVHEERCWGNSTTKQKEPCTLKVFHLWDSLQELGVAGDDLLKLTFDEFWSAQWSAQRTWPTLAKPTLAKIWVFGQTDFGQF